MTNPGRGRGRIATIATTLAVVGIIAAGITLGRSVGDGIEARVAPEQTRRSVARSEPVLGMSGTGFSWGVYRDGAPYDRVLIQDVERAVGRRPAFVMWYHEWHGDQLFPAADAAWLAERDIIPVISWEPWRPPVVFGDLVVNQPVYRLANIASGSFDTYIRAYADAVRDYGGPIMLRPFHEMDGDWYPWGGTVNGNTPRDFVRAWRRVHTIFAAAGATNVTWVWSVNHVSVPNTPENRIARYWPGEDYVDWTAMSGFNWGRASPLSVWKGIDAVIGDRYRELLRYGKPIVLMETGAPEIGGDKPAWIASTFARLGTAYPGIDAVLWYDRRDSEERDWRIDSTPAALTAFRRAIRQPYVHPAGVALATTEPGSSRGTPPVTDTFTRLDLGPAWHCTRTLGEQQTAGADGGQATVTFPPGAARSVCLMDGTFANVEAGVSVAWTRRVGAQHNDEAELLVRATHATRHYAFVLGEGDGSAAVASIRRTAFGKVMTLATVQLPFPVEASTRYEIRGSARTTDTGIRLEMRVWRVGAQEPTTPTLSFTDGARERLARGATGFAVRTGGGSRTAFVDDFSAR